MIRTLFQDEFSDSFFDVSDQVLRPSLVELIKPRGSYAANLLIVNSIELTSDTVRQTPALLRVDRSTRTFEKPPCILMFILN